MGGGRGGWTKSTQGDGGLPGWGSRRRHRLESLSLEHHSTEHRARVVGRHRLLQLHRHLLCSSCPHGAPPIPSESPQQPHPSIHRSLIIFSCPQDSPKTFSVLLTPSVELSAPHIPQHSPPVHPRCPPPPAALSATPPYRHPAPSLEPRPRGRGAADLARPLAAACPPARGPPSATL